MAVIMTSTEDRMSDCICSMRGIIQSLETDMQYTDDDHRIISLSGILEKANRALLALTTARMCYRAIGKEDDSGGDAGI